MESATQPATESHLHQDLHQVLQRLIDEKQRVKKLERELSAMKESNGQLAAPTNESVSSKDKQIVLLKRVIEELSQKIKELQHIQAAPTPPQEVPSDTKEVKPEGQQVIKLRHELYQSQTEVREAREKIAALDEEVKRLRGFRQTLQHEMKDFSLKAQENEQLRKELLANKKRLQELEDRSAQFNASHQQDLEREELLRRDKLNDERLIQGLRGEIDVLKKNLENASVKAQVPAESPGHKNVSLESALLEAALEDQKLIAQELSKRNHELEKKLHQISQEKETTRSNKEASLEKSLQRLREEKDELLLHIEEIKAASMHESAILKKERELAQHHELKVHELKKELINAQSELEIIKKRADASELELQTLRETAEAKEKQFQETNERVSLLEHHLARRVKECALLSKTQEEQTIHIAELNNKATQQDIMLNELTQQLQDKEKTLLELKEKHIHESRLKEEKTHHLEQEKRQLVLELDSRGRELQRLKEIEDKFVQISHLLNQFGTVMTQRTITAPPPVETYFEAKAPKAEPQREPLFTLQTKPYVPIKGDFFE